MKFLHTIIDESLLDNAYLGCWGTFGIKKELNKLTELLMEGERVEALTRGMVDRGSWVMAVTNARIILLDIGLLFGHKQLEVPIPKIKSVSYRTGLFFGSLYIDTGGGTLVLEAMSKKNVATVANVVCQALNSYKDFPFSQPTLSAGDKKAGALDLLSQLERLQSLRRGGILTEGEVETLKKRLFRKEAVKEQLPVPPEPRPLEVKAIAPKKPKPIPGKPDKTERVEVKP